MFHFGVLAEQTVVYLFIRKTCQNGKRVHSKGTLSFQSHYKNMISFFQVSCSLEVVYQELWTRTIIPVSVQSTCVKDARVVGTGSVNVTVTSSTMARREPSGVS